MPIKILMPALSPTMEEGNLAKWHKKEGDKINPGEVIAEIETDKATMEVEAVDEGRMGKIIVPAGTENVKVNSLIAILLEEGEEESALDDFKFEERDHKKETDVKTSLDTEVHIIKEIPTPKSLEDKNVRIFASPLARKIAELEGVDLANIKGSGPHGRIIKSDVIANISKSEIKTTSHSIARDQTEYKIIPNNNIRKIIAKRLQESKQTIPHFYLSIECNIDKLLEVREDVNLTLSEDKTRKVSVNDFIILAVAKALQEVPEANASWELAGIKYYNNIDVSVAVAIEGGLITPIIKNADKKNIYKISSEMKELARKARENKLNPEEFQGGGFSISNLGMYGIKKFSAIINPPQSCILAVGEGSRRAVVINDEIKIATMIDVTLSCDHRVVDGAIGAKFLSSFKKFIERPTLMLIG